MSIKGVTGHPDQNYQKSEEPPMFEPIEALDAYNKNINILIGSGASADLFPTLGLEIKGPNNEWQSIETLTCTKSFLEGLFDVTFKRNILESFLAGQDSPQKGLLCVGSCLEE